VSLIDGDVVVIESLVMVVLISTLIMIKLIFSSLVVMIDLVLTLFI